MADRPTEFREHPSYGLISIGRVNWGGKGRLFGSALANHQTSFRIRIGSAKWQHDLHEDRYYEGNCGYIEVELSAAQFVQAITSINSGQTPCTIRRRLIGTNERSEALEEPPDVETEVERIKSAFAGDVDGMIERMQRESARIEKLAEKLPAKTRREIQIALQVMTQQLSSNVPFILEQFNESSERVVTAAKQEIEAFAQHTIRTAGLEAIAERGALGPGDDK